MPRGNHMGVQSCGVQYRLGLGYELGFERVGVCMFTCLQHLDGMLAHAATHIQGLPRRDSLELRCDLVELGVPEGLPAVGEHPHPGVEVRAESVPLRSHRSDEILPTTGIPLQSSPSQ